MNGGTLFFDPYQNGTEGYYSLIFNHILPKNSIVVFIGMQKCIEKGLRE